MSDFERDNFISPRTPSTLTGFSSADTQEIQRQMDIPGHSVQALFKALLNLESRLGKTGFKGLKQQLFDHINNYNNPHHDVLDPIGEESIVRLLGNVVPGTVPLTAPVYSLGLLLNDISVFAPFTIARASPVILIDKQGMFTTYQNDVCGVDWSDGIPQIPLWNTVRSARLKSVWDTVTDTALNTTTSQPLSTDVCAPTGKQDYLWVVETATTGEFGFTSGIIPLSTQPHTASVFLYPGKRGGYAVLTIAELKTPDIYIDLLTGDVTTADGVIAYGSVLPSGWVRVGLQFTPKDTLSHTFTVRHALDKTSGISRTGGSGSVVFGVSTLQVTESSGMVPVLPDNQAGLAASTLTINQSTLPFPSSRQTVCLGVILNGSLTPLSETIGTIGSAKFTSDGSAVGVTCTVGDTPSFYGTQNKGSRLQTVAISNDQTKVKCQFDDQDATINSGSYGLVKPYTSVTVGPFSGSLTDLLIYTTSDIQKDTEFLTHG